ncbi:MAG TPA: HAD family hydrolase [Cellvibrio sp.]|nr:HAD family hydrolase [Cellvibrio sp.]
MPLRGWTVCKSRLCGFASQKYSTTHNLRTAPALSVIRKIRYHMHHVMFDIDGTLIESYELDSQCFIDAVQEITGLSINSDWSKYQHVTDSGILNEILFSSQCANMELYKVQIKQLFLKKLAASLASKPVKEVMGAGAFLTRLQSMNNIVVSLATGGWQESAILKLKSAGIMYSSIPLASSNDHYSRIEIMKLAAERASNNQYSCTYFGDGVWDKEACNHLSYNFVLEGNKFEHTPRIKNFLKMESALACEGL